MNDHHHRHAPKPSAPPACCSSRAHEHSPASRVVKPAQDTSAPAGIIYTCPMHPEIRQVGPGNCPKCGMALEPEMPGEQADDNETEGVRRKFWIAVALTVPVVVIAMAPHLFHFGFSQTTARILRGGRQRNRRVGVARRMVGAARARPHQRRNPTAAWSRAEDRAQGQSGWIRRRCTVGTRTRRQSSARQARRKNPGRWPSDRGAIHGR